MFPPVCILNFCYFFILTKKETTNCTNYYTLIQKKLVEISVISGSEFITLFQITP